MTIKTLQLVQTSRNCDEKLIKLDILSTETGRSSGRNPSTVTATKVAATTVSTKQHRHGGGAAAATTEQSYR